MTAKIEDLIHDVTRAKQEFVAALDATDKAAIEAHRQLAIRYCEEALDTLSALVLNDGSYDPDRIRDYYLLPWLDFGTASNLRLAPENGILLDAYRFDTLDALLDLSRRSPLKVAA
jgi:hypothetical protein